MAKQFIKVTKTYSTKNKLQNLILNELQAIDSQLLPNKESANRTIKLLYDNAISSYKGKAAVPELKTHEANKNELLFFVEDVIFISVYNVKIDLT